MVKKRPVVVVGRRSKDLCVVVPLSTTEPATLRDFHQSVDLSFGPPHLRAGQTWAKCDMLSTVAYWRLDRFFQGRNAAGRRNYRDYQISDDDLRAVRRGILAALDISLLTAAPNVR